jgi:predicted DNA-binding protein YlxM (UPF0122 family)
MKNRIPKSAITEKQLRRLLRKSADDTSLSAWAVDNGITPQAVSAFIRRVQTAGLQIPEALGYYPQTVYLPLGEEPICTARSSKPKSKKKRR